ncbi:zinc finger MYM-type protein 1-like [Zingiber officinale]|uniref:zinc finger MYM-type protein 1-like n=1 Tax=Zingiber officinale TaxID=94328 RepID=UPI001C4BAA8E|nr:zinc finger MYM-type protein 1-like [Zingiber officinale]
MWRFHIFSKVGYLRPRGYGAAAGHPDCHSGTRSSSPSYDKFVEIFPPNGTLLNVDSVVCRSAAAPRPVCRPWPRPACPPQRHPSTATGQQLQAAVDLINDSVHFVRDQKQGLSFRGHDESSNSLNRGNFLELFQWYSQRNEEVSKVVNQNAPGNNQMISPAIQKDLTCACASEITLSIIEDIGNNVFSLMVDESRDISVKEQMRVVLRYVNKRGQVIERFLAIVHVSDTSSRFLKDAIDALFEKHGLSLSRLRGQGYDGVSNMRGEFNGLKSLILQENPYASYIHCFSHQLQLVIIAVAKSNLNASDFFNYVTMIVNTTGASCKRRDQLRQIEHDRIVAMLEGGDISTGSGKNQETNLVRPGDTRWGSHYLTLGRLLSMWPSVIQVLENICDDSSSFDSRGVAKSLIQKMENYEFVFMLHLMKMIFGMTNELSLVLQQKDQNIVQAISLIEMPEMKDNCMIGGRSRRRRQVITNLHYYRVEIFYQVVDSVIQEMNTRFSEVGT